MQDDAVIEIGGCEARIVLNRQIVRGEGRDGFETADWTGGSFLRRGRSLSRRDRYVGRCFALTLNARFGRVGEERQRRREGLERCASAAAVGLDFRGAAIVLEAYLPTTS